jgi:hypothetical protein
MFKTPLNESFAQSRQVPIGSNWQRKTLNAPHFQQWWRFIAWGEGRSPNQPDAPTLPQTDL